MKHLIVLLICCSILYELFAQPADTTTDLKKYYLDKSRSQKTAAWVLLGSGAAAIAIGSIIGVNSVYSDDLESGFNEAYSGGLLMLAGGAACLTSIPFFVASGKNKRRAMSVTTGSQQIMMPVKGGWAYNMQPAIKITVPLAH